jgi:uncharacterized repeat protein (TIGR01451 family)
MMLFIDFKAHFELYFRWKRECMFYEEGVKKMNLLLGCREFLKRVSSAGQFKTAGLILIAIILLLNASPVKAATCVPQSAVLCAAIDDWANIYINGQYINSYTYCDVSWACDPQCYSLTPAQVALLTPGSNDIAVYTQNTNCCELWASWSLSITCADGNQALISSNSQPVSMYYDSTCAGTGPPTPNPSPTPVGGHNWYELSYTPVPTWSVPVVMSGKKYGKRLDDPVTGNVLPALSYQSTMNTACGALWFRQPFTLTEVPTPMPPNLTITKSANPSANIGQTPPTTVTFTLHICNTGGGTQGNPVVINDTWTNPSDSWSYYSPGSYTDPLFGEIDYSGTNPNATITFANGFNANTCYDYVYTLIMYSGVPTFCINWSNAATLNYLSVPVATASVGLTDYCPPPPSFTLTKSASTTTVNGPNQNITFTMHLCNTGGVAWAGTMTLFDDMSSAPGGNGAWQYTGPYYVGAPATGINNYSTSGSSNVQRTYAITFQQPGFTGCIDIPYYVNSTNNNYGCGPWYNAAYASYYTSPTIVSTVNMNNYCSPTFTPTMTYTYSPTKTFTSTRTVTNTLSPTFTNTNTVTLTQTVTFTPTVTQTLPPMIIGLTKTEDKTVVMLGDNVQYCLNYQNNGSSSSTFNLWDTIPYPMSFVSCTGGCTQSGSLLIWTVNNLAAGNSGSVCFTAKVISLPFLMEFRDYMAWIFDRKKYMSYCGAIPQRE